MQKLNFIIPFGTALTITGVVLLGLSGKAASLSVVSGKKRVLSILEHLIVLIAAMAVAALGLVLFLANY